ncbi:class I SAM-dependent methyltransferase [Acidihalobacter ferrooxydans]|uniref:Methyltransferase type 11 domain-containing protein n=1 Tax=Acidihalobacter ferrooxydans TaxID=1765967 RepID=A0A1P8UH94_9GAMM|nr:class I SAM-dependent methyltransferase [Acidihalobacter ferrooxydans]APZ43215.1 hypothetical protein BW247_09015 [Acidihalobacter ferrooxydans]
MMKKQPICNYENSDYRTQFWEGQGREYEDLVERVALKRLVPARGSSLIEIGAGFGRLSNEYTGYDKVVLFDYSRSLLREAQAHLQHDPRYIFVAGNWYDMPFVSGAFDTIVQVRSLHHATDPIAVFRQMARIIQPRGDYILEYANKLNMKAILRYSLKRQNWSPFDKEPIEFAPLHYDFHPDWIRNQLQDVGFKVGEALSVSYFRVPLLKRTVPLKWLVGMDSLIQRTGRFGHLSPSVFVHNKAPDTGERAPAGQFFACPSCATPLVERDASRLDCPGCGLGWKCDQGLYDFKEPISD